MQIIFSAKISTMDKTDLSVHDKAVLNCVFNPNLPLAEAYKEELDKEITDNEENTKEVEETKLLENEAVRKAEDGNLHDALDLLNDAIKIAPTRASIYNNRAQVYQFQGKHNEALDDLTEAIRLAGDKQFKSLCQAYCQRGLLNRKFEKNELAMEDFKNAAALGSKFAKSQLVELNPYAALCNQMLRKVMEELK